MSVGGLRMPLSDKEVDKMSISGRHKSPGSDDDEDEDESEGGEVGAKTEEKGSSNISGTPAPDKRDSNRAKSPLFILFGVRSKF